MNAEVAQASLLHLLAAEGWQQGFSSTIQEQAISALEKGQVVYFPHLAFHLFAAEMPLLTTRFSSQKRKNISYKPLENALQGIQKTQPHEEVALRNMLARFSEHARLLIENLFPRYQPMLNIGRTSYRPVQITDRPTSPRKDDKRLHVDAFPSAPNQGKRILRVFCNINPHGEDRVWRLGEPFETVIERFLPRVGKPKPVVATFLKWLRITKSYRSAYDHYMLAIHDRMKADDLYQKTAQQMEMRFPPGSTWIVQTDHVSHAAMQGQYMLEQTFYLPVEAMQNPLLSPLRTLENKLQQTLT